jgi:hypothetical protein
MSMNRGSWTELDKLKNNKPKYDEWGKRTSNKLNMNSTHPEQKLLKSTNPKKCGSLRNPFYESRLLTISSIPPDFL